MSTEASRVLQDPDRPHASLVRDQQYGLIFDSYLALHRWRARHDLAEASCHSIDVDQTTGQRVQYAHSAAPTEITA
jgi:hypothetical protein